MVYICLHVLGERGEITTVAWEKMELRGKLTVPTD